ncbi:hypothetical protein LTR08_004162 [Meristemomyces frigidus]|nr:hypothetical protein LTR08_004162 [Meristemomyces frigidus]
MPPTSNIRKPSVANSNSAADSALITKRTSSGRAVRANTTRPANYYARPFGSLSAAAAASAVDNEAPDAPPPGFFPALQYFSDAITALPKEVMRQFTLMKEVEAKIHGPTEQLGDMVDALMELPVPSRKSAVQGYADARIVSLTANNSAMGSASASLVNGVAGGPQHSAQASIAGSVNGEELPQLDRVEELARRRKYHELRLLTHNLLPNLDEKNVVLAEANRVLAQQLLRVDSVMPHVENELSDEARLGSMTHWAYSDNRQKKNAPPPPNRRDVAATNSLAAAANAIHETEIAQARRDAGREAMREKHGGKTKRLPEPADSDFDDKPKKPQAKSTAKAKTAAAAAAGQAAAAATGLGISTLAEPAKRRKIDKGLALPAMERSMSGATKAAKAARDTPRSTPAAAVDFTAKKSARAKPAPALPKKRAVPASSVQNSPALMASSPLLGGAFNPAAMEPPASARPQSARLRQNSSATNLRVERVAEVGNSRPVSAAGGKIGGGNGHAKRKVPHDEVDQTAEEREAKKTTERADAGMKREVVDAHVPEGDDGGGAAVSVPVSREASRGRRALVGARASKTGTPRHGNTTEGVPASEGGAGMARGMSTRRLRHGGSISVAHHNNNSNSNSNSNNVGSGTGRDSSASSAERQLVALVGRGGGKHRRHVSGSHLVKQLAPFNRSPDVDRRQEGSGDDGEGGSGDEGEERGADEGEVTGGEQRGRRSRPGSRRNTILRGEAEGGTSPARGAGLERAEEEGGMVVGEEEGREDVLIADADASQALRASRAPRDEVLDHDASEHDFDEGDSVDGVADRDVPLSPSPAHPHPDYRRPTSHPPAQQQQQQQPPMHPSPGPHTPTPTPTLSPHPSPAPSQPPSPAAPAPTHKTPSDPPSSPASSPTNDAEAEAEADDPDDPNEPKYCYCDRGSYGEMVACDNDACPREWFHLGCTGLRMAPGEEEVWYCRGCRPGFERARRGGGKGEVLRPPNQSNVYTWKDLFSIVSDIAWAVAFATPDPMVVAEFALPVRGFTSFSCPSEPGPLNWKAATSLGVSV